LPGPERPADGHRMAGQPYDGIQWIAETRSPAARADRNPVALHAHPAKPQVDLVDPDRRPPEDEHTRGGIVGNGVDYRDVPVLHPAVDNLDCRQYVRGCTDHVG